VKKTKKKLSIRDLTPADEVLRRNLRDPDFRKEWNRTVIARAVASLLLRYRAEHGLSQTGLAKMVGMQQPAIARLEAGEKNPTWETLARLAETLGIEFLVDIAPTNKRTLLDRSKDLRKYAEVLEANEEGPLHVAVG
jgi:transcriptional regulator with XRE-family HTH domain